MELYESENYENYVINEQEEGTSISVFADVCDILEPEEAVDMLKCDAYYEE